MENKNFLNETLAYISSMSLDLDQIYLEEFLYEQLQSPEGSVNPDTV